MSGLTVLRFEPVFRQYIWGGRRLQTTLGKNLPEGDRYAESWEVVDHGQDQSIVAFGPHKGRTLNGLLRDFGPALLGRPVDGRGFPLLLKFLDAHRDLSVQVHPDDAYGATMDPPDMGKTEAWVILRAEPGSRIYAGLKASVSRSDFRRAIDQGRTESCLHSFEAVAGDCVFIPAGVVHALGAGLVVAEIQQSSDATFRIFDWNRVGADGRPRDLHIAAAMDVIDFGAGPISPQSPQPAGRVGSERLVTCDKFVMERWRFHQSQAVGGDGTVHLLAVLDGQVRLHDDSRPLTKGQSALVPASVGPVEVQPAGSAVLLDMYLP